MPRLFSLLVVFTLGVLGCERREQPAPAAPATAREGTAPAQSGPILIGSVGSLTGPEASFGAPVRDGIQFAVEQVNIAGGVKGRQVELRAYDSQGRLEDSVSAAQRLVNKDRVLLPAVVLKIEGGKRVFAAAVTP
jgi:branched-chain amino acid transport system substrate-binding protein